MFLYVPLLTCVCCVQELSEACGLLVRLEPMLGVYSELVRYYLAVSLGAHRSTGKLLSVLASIFTELAQKVTYRSSLETASRLKSFSLYVYECVSERTRKVSSPFCAKGKLS